MIFAHKEGEEGSLPPYQASGHSSGAAHHQSSGVQSDGAAATTHGKQSRDTGKHGSEGMTANAWWGHCQAGTCMHACMAPSPTPRPSEQRRYSRTLRFSLAGSGGMHDCQIRASTLITLKHAHTAPPQHAHLPPGQPSEQQGPYILITQVSDISANLLYCTACR